MKKIFIIFFIFISTISSSYSHKHYPIRVDGGFDISSGKLLYNQNCASCHQSNLSGAVDWKGLDKDGHRKAPPMNGTGHTWHHSDETLHAIIKHGLAKLVKNYQGKMMGFGDKLSDKDIDNVLAYIKTYWNEEIYNYQLELSKSD